MICLGFDHQQKQELIRRKCEEHGVRKVYVFYGKARPEYDLPCETEYRSWDDVILYKYFYRLLGEIDKSGLIVADEMMRTQNRNSLTYNCMHHYLNQCGVRLVFEYFPLVEDRENFMILADFEDKARMRRKPFSPELFRDVTVEIVRRDYRIKPVPVELTDADRQKYADEKEKLFAGAESIKDPECLPRRMALLAGNFKAASIDPARNYVARNKRFRASNVYTYKDAPDDGVLLDPAQNVMELHDYLKRHRRTRLEYLTTGLKVDEYYLGRYREISRTMKEIYDAIG
ncbi:MAG: hypothetical protein HPZ91_07615 [Lentisphaeria bacterium]|nr:hypothetical protein [Lentisphaeria bacterium]